MRDQYSLLQTKAPNCILKAGKEIKRYETTAQDPTSKLPDFIGCEKFSIVFKNGLQNAAWLYSQPTFKEQILFSLRATKGHSPTPSNDEKSKCLSLPLKYSGKLLPSPIYSFVSIPLIQIFLKYVNTYLLVETEQEIGFWFQDLASVLIQILSCVPLLLKTKDVS